MDLGTIIGFLSGLTFLVVSMSMPANFDFSVVANAFVDPASIMITLGGTLAATFIGNPLSRIISALRGAKVAVLPPKLDAIGYIEKIVDLSKLARREGVLALDGLLNEIEDPFLKKGVMLVADGADAELIRGVLETDINYIGSRHEENGGVWEFVGAQAPSWGMIGTLIGLIMMLRDLNDVSKIGPNMAIAIITTFYGSLLANFVALPIAAKMKTYSSEELLLKEMIVEGMLSIQAGENPRIIEEKLKAFLSPALRAHTGEDKNDGE